jgi:DNA-binding response OmpR family regulator
MLTAKAQKEAVIKGLSMGASDYVLKPYKFTELLSKVQNLIG